MNEAEVESVREQLAAGSQRGLGRAAEIARAAARSPEVLREVVDALKDERDLVVTRAANALKQVQRAEARALDGFAASLLRSAGTCAVLKARWNLLLLLGRVRLTQRQRAQAVDLLFCGLGAESALERVYALDALAHISLEDAALRLRVQGVLARALEDGSAAVRARARKLLKRPGASEDNQKKKGRGTHVAPGPL